MKRFNHFAHRNIVILMLLILFENLKFFFNKITLISSGVFGLFDFMILVYTSFLIVYPIIYIFTFECQLSDQKKTKKQKPKETKIEPKESEEIEESGKVNKNPILQQGKRSNNENLEFIEKFMSRKILQQNDSRRAKRLLMGEEQSIYIRGEFHGDVKQQLFKIQNFQTQSRRVSGSVPRKLRILNRKIQNQVGIERDKTDLVKIEEEKEPTEIEEKKLDDYYDSNRSKPRTIVELDLEKYPFMNRDYSAGLIYVKNVVVYGLIILGNRNSLQNLFIVLQIQFGLTIWLGISKPKHLTLKWSWRLQELYFNFYLITLIIFFVDPNENRQNWMLLSYFIGFSVSVLLFVYYIFWEIIYLPFKKFLMSKLYLSQNSMQLLKPSDH